MFCHFIQCLFQRNLFATEDMSQSISTKSILITLFHCLNEAEASQEESNNVNSIIGRFRKKSKKQVRILKAVCNNGF